MREICQIESNPAMMTPKNGCDCRTAVSRTFAELRSRQMSKTAALESAAEVFRFHHPGLPAKDALKTVDEWIGC
jgi:hypothetical protein